MARGSSLQWARCLMTVCLATSFFRLSDAAAWGRLSRVSSLKTSSQAAPDLIEGVVKYDAATGTFSFMKGLEGGARTDNAPAHGSFSDPLRHKSNFGQLRITTNPSYTDEVQMQAAGFLEGYLTAERIFDYAYNMKSWLADQTNDTFKVGDWLFDQDRWARQMVNEYGRPDGSSSDNSSGTGGAAEPGPDAPEAPPAPTYWRAVGLLIAQADGMMAGYLARLADMGPEPPLERLTKWDFLVLNALGDMDDLLAIIFPDADDGSGTADYDDLDRSSSSSSGGAGRAKAARGRIPNPERDSSFFFRLEEGAEAVQNPRDGRQQQQQQEPQDVLKVAAPRGPWSKMSPGEVRARIAMRGRCTALVKVTPGLDDLLLGHVTWWGYASMLRIYKHYDLRLTALRGLGGGPVNSRVSFSSYPGQISSADDWYLLGSGLVVTETSLDTFDHNRYNATYGCTTASLLSWQRVLAANLLAVDGPGWAAIAAAYNGGTYNNQYMVVNLNLFNPGAELQPGLLTVTEIIPGLSMTADATEDLQIGHWPSYNVPYFPEIYEAAGYKRHAEAMAARGPQFAEAAEGISYQLAPRAKIFRRDAALATELGSFRQLLRSNGWERRGGNADPLSATPWDALCARGDLDPDYPALYGCYDGKVTNYRRALELSADAINGPTTEGGRQPFRWDDKGRTRHVKYRGLLDVYDTEWEEQRP